MPRPLVVPVAAGTSSAAVTAEQRLARADERWHWLFGSTLNRLDAEAAKHLAEGLKTNSTLQTLKYAAARPKSYCH